MMNITVAMSALGAKKYFAEEFSREGYYTELEDARSVWGGKLAEQLGLKGQVDKQNFDLLCDNINPATGKRLTVRSNDYRRIGYDITFNAPKSASLAHAINGDPDILAAFNRATRETMAEIESQMCTRVRREGKDEDRVTGNALWASFLHKTARPVAGQSDPHLHQHSFLFNSTFDSVENRIKAGQFYAIKKDAPYHEAAWHARFAKNLSEVGYGIQRTEHGWELQGVSPETITKFSRRTQEIERVAKAKGITNPKTKAGLAVKTREPKQNNMPYAKLQEIWQERLTWQEKRDLAQLKNNCSSTHVSPQAAVDYTLAHAYERVSVVSYRKLLVGALRYGVGSVTVAEIKQELSSRRDIITKDIDGEPHCTTANVLAEENKMLELVKQGRGQYKPLGRYYHGSEKDNLSQEQAAAINTMVTSRDLLTGLIAPAGTGKTKLMKAAIKSIEENWRRVHVFGPTSENVRDVLRGDGFTEARTLASLLRDPKVQAKIRGHTIWVDESGQLAMPELKQLCEIALKNRARIVLSGCTTQHTSVARGDSLRTLEKHAGIRFARLNKIFRQRGLYKEAVAALGKGDVVGGFKLLEEMGAIKEVSEEQRYQQLAHDYVQAINEKKSVLAVSPTHLEAQKVNALIRANLRQENKLQGTDREFLQQKNLSWTQAQRADASQYKIGHLIQFHQHCVSGFKSGQKVRVVGRQAGQVMVQSQWGKKAVLPLHQSDRFNVYNVQHLALARGDKIRITQNGKTSDGHRLNNGSVYQVKSFSVNGDIKLTNGWTLSKTFGNFNHGYCGTSYSSQGKTVDRVLIAESTNSPMAISREQFYVSVSRGRESVMIYTDDKVALRQAATRSSQRMSAIELAQRGGREKLVEQHALIVNRDHEPASGYQKGKRMLEKYGQVQSQEVNDALQRDFETADDFVIEQED